MKQNKKLLTASSDSTIASFNAKSGALQWRVVLPAGTKIHQLVAGEGDDVFALTSHTSSVGTTNYIISSYNGATGSLVWDHPIKTDEDSTSSPAGYTDLVVDLSRKMLTVLAGNTVSFYSVFGNALWNWSPTASDNAQIIEQAKLGRVLRISQLAVPMLAEANAAAAAAAGTVKKPLRLAVGCFVSSNDLKSSSSPSSIENPTSLTALTDVSTPVCSATAVLSATAPGYSNVKPVMEVKTFAALPTVAYTSLRASISSDASAALDANDVLFGIARGDSAAKMVVLSLSSNSAKTVDLPNKEVANSGAAFLLDTDEGDVVPAAVFCSESKNCEYFAIAPVGGKNTVATLGTCGTATTTSRIGLQRHAGYASVAEAIACAEANAPVEGTQTCAAAGECSARSERAVKVTATTVDSESSMKASKVSVDVVVPGAGVSGIHLVAVERFAFAASKDSKGTEGDKAVRALVVFKAGLTAMVQTEKDAAAGKVLWTRDESLSRVKQSVIVEDPRGTALHATTADGEIEKLPDLKERLEMQLTEIKVTLLICDDCAELFYEFLCLYAVSSPLLVNIERDIFNVSI
jgi:hypothetical protein